LSSESLISKNEGVIFLHEKVKEFNSSICNLLSSDSKEERNNKNNNKILEIREILKEIIQNNKVLSEKVNNYILKLQD
jgi:hypothetical protein